MDDPIGAAVAGSLSRALAAAVARGGGHGSALLGTIALRPPRRRPWVMGPTCPIRAVIGSIGPMLQRPVVLRSKLTVSESERRKNKRERKRRIGSKRRNRR